MRKRSEAGAGAPVPDAKAVVDSIAGGMDEVFSRSAGTRVPGVAALEDLETAFAAPAADSSDVGEEVEATWGKEYAQPIQFHGVEIGPFTARTVVREGETSVGALARLYRELDAFAQAERARKIDAYVVAMREMHARMDRR